MPSVFISKVIFFSLILGAVIFEVAGDIFFKKWALENQNLMLLIGLSIYFLGAVFWALSLKYEYLSKAISVFMVLNLIAAVLAGVIIFKEDLSLLNKIGILFGILSVILLEI